MNTTHRLLVVEDEPDIRELLALNFFVEGFDVLTCANGVEAEEVVRTEEPDLVVLDVMMPERDGLAVLASMRADPELRDIPVVLLSACSTDSDIWSGWKAGADYYVTKPFDLDKLVKYVRYILAGGRGAEHAEPPG